MMVLVAIYEGALSHWFGQNVTSGHHALGDTLVYGTIGPFFAFLLIDFVDKYLQERETADLQARLLAQVRDDAETSRQLSDDAVQVLYSASTLIESLKACHTDLPADTAVQVELTENALQKAIHNLRSHLLD